MKYIRKKMIIHDVCNCKITDINQSKDILTSIKNENAKFSIWVLSGDEFFPKTIHYKEVLIEEIKEEGISLLVLNPSGKMHIPIVEYGKIEKIVVISNVIQTLINNKETTRWGLLDIEGIQEDVSYEV